MHDAGMELLKTIHTHLENKVIMPVYSPQYGVLGEDDRLRSDVGPAQSCKDKAHDCGIQQHAKAHLTHDD